MTKEVPQRRGTVSSGGAQGSRKLPQDVTVVKHYQPNPVRKHTTNFPEVKAFQDFPTTTRYLQLNPVFKLVDNYLASKQPACCHHGPLNGAFPGPVKNCRCSCMRNVQGDTTLKNYTTKKSPVPVSAGNCPHKNRARWCENPAKIKTNLNNINSKTNVKISLKNGCVPPCDAPAVCPIQPSYVEQLKAEIKSSRKDYNPRKTEDSDYVSKLKDEIIVNKNQCINEARAIINELKNEILNFRLRPKLKYSSSCSNLQTCGDKAVKSASKNLMLQKSKESPEKICACAAKAATCCPSPGKEKAADLERLIRPFETLWRTSRHSFASSSDMDAVSLPSPGVSFEQKLEEANSLIEKVRKALKDIGKGIQHKPSEKRKFSDIKEPIVECSNDSKCINMVCSFHGACGLTATEQNKTNLAQRKEEMEKQQKEESQKQQEEELQKQKEEALRKQLEEQLRKQIQEEVTKEKAEELQKRVEEQSRKDEESRRQKEEELRKKEAELVKLEELSKQKEEELLKKEKQLEEKSASKDTDSAELSGGAYAFDNVAKSSIDQLQKRLKDICEMSSESRFDCLQIQPAVQEELLKSKEDNNSDSQSKEDSVPRSISDVITDSESSVNTDENPERVDPEMVESKNKQLPCDDECSEMSEGKSKEDYKARVQSESKQEDFESLKRNTKELGKRRSSSKQRSKSSKSYNVDLEERKRMQEEKAKRGSAYAFEGRKRTKQEWKSMKSSDAESEERKRSRQESKSSKSCDFKNLKSNAEDFDGRRSKSRLSKSYGTVTEEERESKDESKSFKSFDFANIKNSSEDFDEKKGGKRSSKSPSIEIEGRKGSKQSKSKTSTEASSTKSAKLSIQVMPPVNIRGGLVMQRTLNLCIKPTGSSENVIVGEHPNVGYREVKTNCEKEEDKELLKNKCPEECGDLEHRCKYRVLGMIAGTLKSKSGSSVSDSENAPMVNPDLLNALNENALLLYKSYQILDNKYQPSGSRSTSSLAVTSKMAKNIAETRRRSPTSYFGRKPKAVDKTEEEVIKQVLEHGKTPWEIGFYQTKATQCSGTSLSIQRENISSSLTSSSGSIPSQEQQEQGIVETPLGFGPVGQEEPVKDESPVVDESSIETATRVPNMSLSEVINALKSGVNMEMQRLLMEQLMNYDASDASVNSKRSQVIVEPPTGLESPPLKFEPLTESDLERRGPRKSILSNRISFSDVPYTLLRHMKKSVSSSSSTTTAEDDDMLRASAALVAADTKIPKKVISSSSSSTTTSSTSSSYNIHGSVGASVDPGEPIGSPKLPVEESGPSVSIMVKPELEEIEEQKEKEDEKIEENRRASTLATTTSNTSESESSFSNSRQRMNTITCFIKGLTGTSQEELDKLRSNPSFPKTDIREWSTTQVKTLDSSKRSSDNKDKEVMSKRSIYEVTLEEIMDSHDYGDRNEEDKGTFTRDRASEVTQLSEKAQKKRVKDFQTFAKETIVSTSPKSASSKNYKKKSSAIVMTMAEERDKFECGDECTEGGAFTNFTRRDLPFYRRVLGRVVDSATRQPMDMAQSDPIPLDDSVSEGEIQCKCSVSIGEVHPCKYSFDKWTSGIKQLKKHPEEPIRKEFGDKSLRISRQRTQYNNWVAFYLQKRKPVVFNDSSSTSPINSSDR